jgi:RNA ligase (TIGR02306 family)
VLDEDDEVVITVKIHGTNSRVGKIEGELMAGSHGLRRKKPETVEEGGRFATDNNGLYWYPLSLEPVIKLLNSLGYSHDQVILYGEIYSDKIQKEYHYDTKAGEIGYRVFDILIDGKYLDYEDFKRLTDDYGIPTVPVLYIGKYDKEKIKVLASSQEFLADGDHIREGVVVKPVKEMTDKRIGRVIFKYISDEYLLSKGFNTNKDI